MKKAVFFVVLAAVMVFVSCGAKPGNTQAGSPVSAEGSLKAAPGETYYMITFHSGSDFWKAIFMNFKRAADLYGAEVKIMGTPADDASDLARILEQVAATKPAGIALAAVNADAMVEPINKIIEAGIPLVTFDSDSPNSKRLSYVAVGNYGAGRVAGEAIAQAIGGRGTISGTIVPGAENLEERWRGVRTVIAEKYPNVKIINPVNERYDEVEAAKQISALLAAHPEVNGLFGSLSSSGVGIGTALKEMGKTSRDIKVFAFDTDAGTLEMLQDGTISGTLLQGREKMGYWSFQMLYSIVHKTIAGAENWQSINPLPPTIDAGVTIVPAERAANYVEDWSNYKY
ncbi:sugar ABC transporter substrate-binding protein [Spirochaetia bacterium]|nr:sugar ABC transporter substrate-binding protein [Spirochaetia bacterium]